ncbi:MAG: hypothetical protein P8X90_33590 [Desulfobacterales bacterium]
MNVPSPLSTGSLIWGDPLNYLEEIFGLQGKTAVVAGVVGAIGTVMSDALLRAGANGVVRSRTRHLKHSIRLNL